MNTNKETILKYFILIPFLCPRGLFEYSSVYKLIFTGWLYLSIIPGLALSLKRILRGNIYKSPLFWIILGTYFYFLADTLIIQHGIREGYQKIFAVPAFCVILMSFFEEDSKSLLECISNILIVNMGLNITLCSPFFWPEFFSAEDRILFIGHIQVTSQYGILGFFCAYLLNYFGNRLKAVVLSILSIITMIMSGALASIMVLLFMVFSLIIIQKSKLSYLFDIDSRIFAAIIIVFNFIFMECLRINDWNLYRYGIYYKLNGRFDVWELTHQLIENHWLFGYGAYGARIKVEWDKLSRPNGIIYAHNQFYQALIDGGIILLICMVIIIFIILSNINKVNDRNLRRAATIFTIASMVTMITESPMEYYFFFVIGMIIAHLPNIENRKKEI